MAVCALWVGESVASVELHEVWDGPMSVMLRTSKELDDLPYQAVVYDYSCQVWQKLPARLLDESLRWFKPGDGHGYHVSKVELPARLLDDGL